MRRVNGLAGLSRAIAAGATSAAAVTQYRLTQAALYSTNSSFKCGGFAKYVPDQFGKSHPSISLGSSAFFSAAATSLAQEAYAKEPSLMQNFLPKEVVLYQYEACPFCNKVKAFLDYYNIPYKVVEVNPINKKEIKWSNYEKVPILKVDGDQMVDSSDIIMKLFQKIYPNKTEIECDEERFWFGWVDNHLVHLLSPNIYRSPSEALESFDYITTQGNFSFTERLIGKYAGAAAMYFVSKKLKKRHNITDERAQLYEAAEAWVDSLKGREYLGDTKPNLADLAVFGVLRPIRHLQAGRDMMKHTRIGEWYNRMESGVGQSLRIKE